MWLQVGGPVPRRVALSMHHHVNHSTHPSLRDIAGPWEEGCGGPSTLRTRHHCVCVGGGVGGLGGGDCRAGVMTDLFPGSLLQPHVTSMPGASWHGQDSLWGT